jgi:crotonobetainyl-CoA:carnitine CoA-transferase CaiB-like acyl-CoA transferase
MDLGLQGIKVIEVTKAVGAPMASRLLADWGADVIKIDHEADFVRKRHDKYVGSRGIVTNINYVLQNISCNKRGITLDLSKDVGREIMYKLVEKADVFMSNLLPRQLEKFKLEYKTLCPLNPKLIYACFTGFGRKGPDKNAPAYGTVIDARAGLLHVLQVPGTAPVQMPLAHADFTTALALAYGIMMALFIRERTGVGQEVDVSLFDTGVWTLAGDIGGVLVTGQDRRGVERKDSTTPTMCHYETKDGRWLYLMVVPQTERYWPIFCKIIDREDLLQDPRFESPEKRVENHLALFNILEEVILTKTLDEWRLILNKSGLPWSPVQTLPEVINDPQARANDFFVPLDHPTYGRMEILANPVKLSKTQAMVRPAPEFSEHTDEVLMELGYTREDIAKLREQAVIV